MAVSSIDQRGWRRVCLRETVKPTAVPRAIGKRIDAAGLAKIAAGSVRDGMKVVIFAILCYLG